ncbi:hypothetical protein FKM82_000941 [Ascaphus truei]
MALTIESARGEGKPSGFRPKTSRAPPALFLNCGGSRIRLSPAATVLDFECANYCFQSFNKMLAIKIQCWLFCKYFFFFTITPPYRFSNMNCKL